MAARTNAAAVRAILGDDYGLKADGSEPDLIPYIQTASVIVDRVSVCATNKGVTLTSTELELIERWMAAHYYTKSDPTYQSRSTQGASGSFVRDPENPEPYRATAVDIDYTGCLNAVLKRQRAGSTWGGKPFSSRIPWRDRN